MRKALLGIALIAAMFAGCVDEGGDAVDDTPVTTCAATAFEDPGIQLVDTTFDPINEDRENFAYAFNTTNVRTCSLAAIGHTPLRWAADGTPAPHGYIGEIDMKPEYDLGAVAVLGTGETPTVYVLDISNRSNPEVLSSLELPGTHLTDVKISDDGVRLFVASQTIPGPGELYGLTAAEPVGPTGFTVYDISDPAAPQYVINIPDSQIGCHMLSHEIVGTTQVVACISQQVRLHAFDTTGGQFAYIGFVDYFPSSGPAGLPVPSGVPAVGNPQGALSSGPHDMTIQRDPVTGDLVMIVSHWGEGLRVVDLNNAPQATEIGVWNGEGAKHFGGNVHSAMMFYTNGTRYIMATPEYTSGDSPPASMWILDATDYANLKLVAEWYHPGEHPSHGLYLTTHQWQVAPTGPEVPIEDVHVYLTMNHAGLWVLGFDEMLHGDLQGAIKGFHLSRTPLDPDHVVTSNAVLNTWDVNVADGYIYGSDRATGLWIFQYEGDTLGDPAVTGFA